jgi:hypothetical protein
MGLRLDHAQLGEQRTHAELFDPPDHSRVQRNDDRQRQPGEHVQDQLEVVSSAALRSASTTVLPVTGPGGQLGSRGVARSRARPRPR